MRLYKVKLGINHDADANQIIDGYLGNAFGDGKICIYPIGDAKKKARFFGGKAELHKEYITSNLNILCINHFCLSEGFIKYITKNADVEYASVNDKCHIYSTEVLEALNNEIILSGEDVSAEDKDEIRDLLEITMHYMYFQIIF